MKRLLLPVSFLLPLLLACMLVAILSPTGFSVAYADEEYTVRFYHENTLLSETLVPRGQTIAEPSSEILPLADDEVLLWTFSSGEKVAFPFTPTENVSLYCEILPQADVVTYSFRSDCLSETRYHETKLRFLRGESTGDLLSSPALVAGGEIIGYYASPAFNRPVALPTQAEKDLILYPLYRKTVRIRFNTKIVTCMYGDKLSAVLGSETYSLGSLYLDEERTIRYAYGSAFDGLYVYGDLSRTQYAVTFVLDETRQTVYVPVHGTLKKSAVPEVFLGYEYTVGNEKISFPYTPADDVVILCAEKGEKRYDAVVWSVLAAGVFLAGLAGVFSGKIYPKMREKREKKKENDKPSPPKVNK